jgi:hypothetical protein
MGCYEVVVVTPKMAVFEQDSLHFFFMQQFFAPVADLWKVFLMDHFVALKVKKPIAGTGGLGNIGLVGMFHATRVLIEVPNGMDDPDLIRSDILNLRKGIVVGVAVAKSDDKLVDEGQDRTNGLLYGVIQFGGIAHHRKSANGHVPVFSLSWIRSPYSAA